MQEYQKFRVGDIVSTGTELPRAYARVMSREKYTGMTGIAIRVLEGMVCLDFGDHRCIMSSADLHSIDPQREIETIRQLRYENSESDIELLRKFS